MAWTFNATGSQVRIPDGAHLDVPNGDWSFCGWFRVSDNTGTNFRRIISWGTPGGNPHVQVFVPGISAAGTNKDKLSARVKDSSGNDSTILFNPSFAISGNYDEWLAWCLTHDDSTNNTVLHVYDTSSGTVYTDYQVQALASINIAADLYVGATSSGSNNDRFLGDLAETAFFSGLFMDNVAFARWTRGRSHRYPDVSWYLPMLGDREEDWGPTHQTPNTTNVATTEYTHPPVMRMSPYMIGSDDGAQQIASGVTHNESVNHAMTLVDSAGRVLPVSIGHTMTLTSGAAKGFTVTLNDVMVMVEVLDAFNFVDDRKPAGNTLNLTQEVQTLSALGVTQNLGLTQNVQIQGPTYLSVSHTLALTSHTSTPHRAFITQNLGLSQRINTPLPTQVVSHTLNLVQDAPIGNVNHTLNLTQSVGYGFGQHITQNLGITDSMSMTGIFTRSVLHDNFIGHALTWYEESPCAKKQYTPFQGENTVPTSDTTPPRNDLQDPQGDTGNFSVYQPYLGVPTSEVILRNPELDNRDRRTLAVTIVGLKETDVDALQTFMQATVGQEIGLTDWEGRLWKGYITNPNEPAVQDGRAMWTVSFLFEGEMLLVEQPGNEDGNGMEMNLTQSVTAVIV
jgi:hypothetical protein